jgi:hypothetical protein
MDLLEGLRLEEFFDLAVAGLAGAPAGASDGIAEEDVIGREDGAAAELALGLDASLVGLDDADVAGLLGLH